jgi:NADP-dependent 3-hydroxy acid dehydrogenase YdfG
MPSPRIIWITGASSGIGRSLAQVFVLHGDTVVASARRKSQLEELKKEVSSSSGFCRICPCDVGDESQVASVSEIILKEFGHVDVLVNCAGITYFKDFSGTTTREFDELIRTNLRGLFLTTKSVLPDMLKRGTGTVMNILSYAGKVTYTGSSAYAASKAGAEAMMDVLRAETRDKGIKIVNVFPGAVLTPIWRPTHQERYGHIMMKPAEIANILYDISLQPSSMMIEDIIIRPQAGDLKV